MVESEVKAGVRRILARLFVDSLEEQQTFESDLAHSLNQEKEFVDEAVSEAQNRGLIEASEKGYVPTEKGRSMITVVFTGGVYDIIHPGHIYTLSSSKALGDVLVVSVARDVTVTKKRNSPPINDENTRRHLVQSIRYVDAAILGSEKDIFETVQRVKPDIIVLGYDQKHDSKQVEAESLKRGVKARVVRLDSPMPQLKSSNIKTDPNVMNQI